MNIIDIGNRFGMPAADQIFRSWDGTVTINEEVLSLDEINELLPSTDLMVLGGGGDIHPALYGHYPVSSYVGRTPSFRDMYEMEVIKMCVKNSVPLLGICRGAQILCAHAGGALVQDISGHHDYDHDLLGTISGEKIPMTTAHHQMMWPEKIPHELIAWVDVKSPRRYQYDTSKMKMPRDLKKEPEIVYFPETNSLGIQGHPEYYSDPDHETLKYIHRLLKKYLFKQEN